MLSPLSDPWPRMDAEWSYDPMSGRYRRPSGRFMSEKAVTALLDGRIGKLGENLQRFTRLLADGLRTEYRYLQGFANDILAGRVSAPMALARVKLYAEAIRGSYWEGATIRQEKQGYSMMRRRLDEQAAHCDDCIRYAARGLVPIGSLPLPGQRCECRSNCRCFVEYKRGAGVSVPV